MIGNDLQQLALVAEAVESFGAEHGIPRKTLNDVQIVLDEVLSNVIKYAWPGGGAHEVRIGLTARGGDLEVEIVDDGQRFDPLGAPAPASPGPGQRRRPGGVGIHIVKQLVDAWSYTRADGYNRLIMTKRRAPGAPATDEARKLEGT